MGLWMANGWEKLVESLIGLAAAFIFGSVVTALQTRKRFEEFDRRVVEPLRAELASLKRDSGAYVTREELHAALNSLRNDLKDWISELREDVRALRQGK